MNESNLSQLYHSAVEAFPFTTLRQFATQPIVIKNIQWIPFLGTKTLFVKGLAQHEQREYNPIILFKGLKFQTNENMVDIWASDGLPYRFQKLSLKETEVVLRCNCLDFHWRFAWYLGKDLYGHKPKKYIRVEGSNRPPVNPSNAKGVCKHLIKLSQVLRESGIVE